MRFSDRKRREALSEVAEQDKPGRRPLYFRIKSKMKYYFKRYGWKVGIAIFLFYLIRDTLLYLVIPYLIAKEVMLG